MIVSEKSNQNLSDYIKFLLNKRFKFNKRGINFSEKIRNSGNHNDNYAHSFFGNDF